MTCRETAVAITGIGIIAPGVTDMTGLASRCGSTNSAPLKKVDPVPAPPQMNSRELRRMAPLTRLALYASDKAFQCQEPDPEKCGLCIGLTHGSTSFLREFHDFLFDYGPQMASPNAFSNGVTNAPLGAISKNLGITGGGGTLVGFEQSGMLVLDRAARLIHQGVFTSCCAGAAEEYSEIVEGAYRTLHWYNGEKPAYLPFPAEKNSPATKGFLLSEASVFFFMTSDADARLLPEKKCCLFSPVSDPAGFDAPVDLIISGAGAGPQDEYELSALHTILSSQKNPPALIFSKPFFGETFAPGSLLSGAIAWDILVNGQAYPSFPAHPSLKEKISCHPDFTAIKSILVIAAGRDKQVQAGLFTKPVEPEVKR